MIINAKNKITNRKYLSEKRMMMFDTKLQNSRAFKRSVKTNNLFRLQQSKESTFCNKNI